MNRLNFYKEEKEKTNIQDTWKILICDDEEDVHTLTKTVLKNFIYKDKKLEFISTYNANDTTEAVKNNDDIVLVLLDVVMESDDAGLKVVKAIREDLNNQHIQIVLRTGQSGLVPETKVVMEYAINDYKEKTELTSKKLITTIITAIRSYENIRALTQSKSKIETLNYDLKKLVNSLDKNVITCKVNDEGKLIYVSRALCRAFEYEADELLGNKTINYIHPSFDKNKYEEIKKAYKEYSAWKGEVQFKTKTGKSLWTYAKREIEYDENGNFLNYIIILQDITAQKDFQQAVQEIEILNEEIIDTQKEVIFRLGAIAEARSKETGMHVKRVAEYSKLLALYYGLPKDEVDIIKVASPMHDIGKVAIPDNILNKPGKFTPEEFEIMKTHSQIGYEMLRNSDKPILKAAAIIAHQHQEKFDGSGYPQALSGENIHIYGRITAVADVFDALGSDRVYKKAWEDEKIFDFFKDQSGRHFDPQLIDLFFEHMDEFLTIRDKFKDV